MRRARRERARARRSGRSPPAASPARCQRPSAILLLDCDPPLNSSDASASGSATSTSASFASRGAVASSAEAEGCRRRRRCLQPAEEERHRFLIRQLAEPLQQRRPPRRVAELRARSPPLAFRQAAAREQSDAKVDGGRAVERGERGLRGGGGVVALRALARDLLGDPRGEGALLLPATAARRASTRGSCNRDATSAQCRRQSRPQRARLAAATTPTSRSCCRTVSSRARPLERPAPASGLSWRTQAT